MNLDIQKYSGKRVIRDGRKLQLFPLARNGLATHYTYNVHNVQDDNAL